MLFKKRYLININYLVFVVIIILIACNPIRKTLREPIKEKGADFLIDNMKKNEIKYSFITLKFSATVKNKNKNTNISGLIRIKKDSVIWISVTPVLGIEAVRILITQDSIKAVNRLEKYYIISNFSKLNKFFDTSFDFDMLQSLITGNDLEYYDNDKFKARVDEGVYKLSTVNRQKIKRYVRQSNEPIRILLQDILLDPSTFKITKVFINEIKENRKYEINYNKFEEVTKQLFPSEIDITISDKEPIKVKLNYSKINIDSKAVFPFKIPEGYNNYELRITN